MFTFKYVTYIVVVIDKEHVLLCLAMTAAVRICAECRFQRFDTTTIVDSSTKKITTKDPTDIILDLTYLMNAPNENELSHSIEGLLVSLIRNPQSVLQELDIQRLRAIIYRDVVRQDRNKSGKNVVIVAVNLHVNSLSISFSLAFSCFTCHASLLLFVNLLVFNRFNFLCVFHSRMTRNNLSFFHWPSSILHRY
jgi:hypothetical protein